MGSLSGAFGTTTSMVVSAALIVVGSLAATVATDFIKNNLGFDISMKGGDALYPFVGALSLLALMNTRTTRTVALGMLASSVTVVAEDFGLA